MFIAIFILNTVAALFFLDYIRVGKLRANRKPENKIIKKSAITMKMKDTLQKAGIQSDADFVFYFILPLIMIPIGIISAVFIDPAGGFLLIAAPSVISAILIKARKKSYDSVFQKNAYRIYKYIQNQISAGVRPVDALRNMHEVIEEKKLAKIFTEACAEYSVSYDASRLADNITDRIDTSESRSFSMSIRDGLFETRDSRLIERLEQMMFNRYFAYIQRMTDSLKTRCLITVILLCSIIVAMILVPTIMDVQNALDSIFT